MRTPDGRILRFVLALCLCAFFWVEVGRTVAAGGAQWDFYSFYGAGRVWSKGGNPYTPARVNEACGRNTGIGFVYSPVVLPAFSALGRLPIQQAEHLWALFKFACLAATLYLWLRYFVPCRAWLWFGAFCLLGFHETLAQDLLAGNVALVEQVLLWGAFLAFLRGHLWAFAGLVAAASAFKLTPLWFFVLLLVPGLGDQRRARRVLGLSTAALMATAGGLRLLAPDLTKEFVRAAAQFAPGGATIERGEFNPTLFALLSDFADHLGGKPGVLVYLPYLVACAGVLIASGVVLQRHLSQEPSFANRRLFAIILSCLAYALISPRFKDYSYVLLLVPTCLVILRNAERSSLAPLFVLAMLVPVGMGRSPSFNAALKVIWSYFPFIIASATWVLALTSRTWSPTPPRSERP